MTSYISTWWDLCQKIKIHIYEYVYGKEFVPQNTDFVL